jgi:hypothetical protein
MDGAELPFDPPLPSTQQDDAGETRSEEAGGDEKPSRSRRRRQRRKEAKRLAQANGGEEAKADGQTSNVEPPQTRPIPARPSNFGRDQAGNRPAAGRPAGAVRPDAGQQRRVEKPRRTDGEQRRGSKGQGGQARDRNDGRRPGSYQERRGGAGRRGGAETRAGANREQRPAGRRRDEGFADSILPPPEVIAQLEGGYQAERPMRGQFRGKTTPSVRILETLSPCAESLVVLTALESAIDEASPLSPKHRAGLKGDIRALWEELTSERESRSADYLGTPPALSAYLRYFLPWNVFRLSSVFSNSDFCLPDKAIIVDIGSGPLTLAIALYASRPELRDVPLTFYCVDRVERVMEAGLAVFETLCMRVEGKLPPWRIELRKDGFGGSMPERAHLLAAVNVFNEFFWKDKRPLGERALEAARSLLGYLRENGNLFVMEPGDPRSGAFIAALRAAIAAEGATPLGPCPHALSCPMPGIFRHLLPPEETRVARNDPNVAPSRYILPPVIMPKKRDKYPWCHFGVDTDSAPAWLQGLSEEAGLPKERAVLSYLWATRGAIARPFGGQPDPVHASEKERRAKAGRGVLVRVVSEPFALPDGCTGQYACSNLGYTLLKRPRGEKAFEPGDLLEIAAAPTQRNDEKSGAIILPT